MGSLLLPPLLLAVVVALSAAFLIRRFLKTTAFANAALRAVRLGGPIPQHVAFIMDGNRRWARNYGLPPSKGHPRGGEKLIDCLKWCLQAGVQTVTVFAFSIENFKRSSTEVRDLMSLAESTFQRFSDQMYVLREHRIRVNVLGDMSLIPPNLRSVFAQVMRDTRKYSDDGLTLNVCFAYAARHDVASAVREVTRLCADGLVEADDIDHDTITACLSSGINEMDGSKRHSFPDLLVRTSGETRLSDFLLWECAHSILTFYPVLWPDLTAWDIITILLDYQRLHASKQAQSDAFAPDESRERVKGKRREAVKKALESVRRCHAEEIDRYAEEFATDDTR